MSNNTKVLRYDLDRELHTVFDQLDELKKDQGNINLFEIFKNINLSMLGEDEKKVILDLIKGDKETGKSATERLEYLESKVGYSVDALIEGDFNEEFEYNADGEIIKHTATGDIQFATEYSYGPLIPVGSSTPVPNAVVLTSSSSKFVSSIGDSIEVKKVYKYDANESIVEINTETLINGV